MAGTGASGSAMDNVECEVSRAMENVKGKTVLLSSSVSAESSAFLESVSKQDVLSCGIATIQGVLNVDPAQLEPLSSDMVLYSSSTLGNAGDCATSSHVLGAADLCNSDFSVLNVERGKSLTETRGTKVTEVCAICHDKVKVEETAEIKGCEHCYCVTCILRWASYKAEPWCPQCRLPFSFLFVYRRLDGSLSDFLLEESVCLLLRAFWFKPLVVQDPEEQDDYQDEYDGYEEPYYTSSLRLGNRRWGDSGYVRAGRREARPVVPRQVVEPSGGMSSSSRQAKGKEQAKEAVGRRARRAQKREQFDKMSTRK